MPSDPRDTNVVARLIQLGLSALRANVVQALDQRRLMLLWPFLIIAGMVTYVAAPAEPNLALLASGLLIASSAVVLSLPNLGRLRLAGLLLMYWIGFCLLPLHGTLFGTKMISQVAYGRYEMTVDEVISRGSDGTRLIVSQIAPLDGARPLSVRRARIVVTAGFDLTPGDRIRAPVRFYPVPGPVLPNAFEARFHAYFAGIGAYGSATKPAQLALAGSDASPDRAIDTIRSGIADRIDRQLQQPSAGIARALITGDQSAVSDASRETMASAGLAHVLSVSGLHLSIVAGLVLVTLRLFMAPLVQVQGVLSVKIIAALGAMVAALGYFAISGGNVAAQRSTIMLLLVLGAVVVGRRAVTMRNVAIAAMIVIATDPASVFRPSFQLSFAAVTALVGAWETRSSRAPKGSSFPAVAVGYLSGIAATSLVAGAATLLFSIYHFQQTSPLSVLGNLFALPLVGFIMMPMGLLAAAMMPVGLEGPPLAAMGWSIDQMLALGQLVANWSSGFDASPLLAPLALGIGMAAFGWFAFLTGWQRLIGPAIASMAVVTFAIDRPPDVLISDTTQAIAVRSDEGLSLVAGKASSFAVSVWSETYADPLEAASPLNCDSSGCFGVSSRGFSIAIPHDTSAFHEDCEVADLVIMRRPAPGRCHATMIDARDLETGGVHWLRWDAGRGDFEIRPAISPVSRVWTIAPP